MPELQFGKKIISESYFEGKPAKKEIAYSIPVVVKDKSQALSEFMKAIDLIISKQTHSITLVIKSDKDHQLKMFTKEYTTESN